MPERMTKTDSSVGIDVSKNWLDIHFGPVPLGRIDRKGRFHRPKRK